MYFHSHDDSAECVGCCLIGRLHSAEEPTRHSLLVILLPNVIRKLQNLLMVKKILKIDVCIDYVHDFAT